MGEWAGGESLMRTWICHFSAEDMYIFILKRQRGPLSNMYLKFYLPVSRQSLDEGL